MYEDKPAPVLMRALAKATRKTYRELAAECGIRPNMFSMIVNGVAALPVTRVRSFAAALGIDLKTLVAQCIASYPDNRGWQAAALTH